MLLVVISSSISPFSLWFYPATNRVILLLRYMEGEMVNAISNSRIGKIVEGSSLDSEINSCQSYKRQRETLNKAQKIFRGVVPLKNGSWGAQIYDSNQRFWLGTFKTQEEAARAYDIIAIKLERDESYLNFLPTNLAMHEKIFHSIHSFEDILEMIKNGTYESKFMDFITIQSSEMRYETSDLVVICGISFRLLFHKELTPSDVGKLNRFVVPKKYAVAHFPPLGSISLGGNNDQGENLSIQLTLQDINLKTWNFLYCYWKSCQSYVITKGWGKFVREKGLKVKDVIIFYGSEDGKMSIMNHVRHVDNEGNGRDLIMQPGARANMEDDIDMDARRGEETKKKFKLFGVEID